MILFVTGGTGFIGSHFLNAAIEAGHQIVALRRPGSRPRLPIMESDRLTWMDGDLRSFFSQSDTMHGAAGNSKTSDSNLISDSIFVHLAAVGLDTQNASWEECFQVNVMDSLHLWRKAADAGIKKFLICGSCFEYGKAGERYVKIPVDAPLEPVGAYAASKAAASVAALTLAREQNLKMILIRPFHVYGEGQSETSFWPSLKIAALAGKDFPMTKGEQIRDFIHAKDLARVFVQALEWQIDPGQPWVEHIGSGHPQSPRQFAEEWWERFDPKGKLLFGRHPERPNEVMRYVPQISERVRRIVHQNNN